MRTFTPPVRNPDTRSTRVTVHRSCNGCGRDLGDATDAEIHAAITRMSLPDVRDECGCAEGGDG